MATNQITIVLEDCEPIGGYYVFYRPVGNLDPHRAVGPFFTSPIIFTDILDPVNQQYEGYIQSHCGGGIFGDPIPWETEGSPSVPGGSEPEPDECCDPVILTADTETTIPDGSLPGSGSEPEVCCTPVILSACIETIDESASSSGSESESGSASGSGSGSESEPELGLRLRIDPAFYNDIALMTIGDWNTIFDTAVNADTPFTSMVQSPGTFEITLYGCTNLSLVDVFANTDYLTGFFDEGICTDATSTFLNCTSLIEAEIPLMTTIGLDTFLGCTNLVTVFLPEVTTMAADVFNSCPNLTTVDLSNLVSAAAACFANCTGLVSINLPSLVSCGGSTFQNCTALTTLGLPVCSDLGGSVLNNGVFAFISGNIMTVTILTATATDQDITTLEANNTVTLILV